MTLTLPDGSCSENYDTRDAANRDFEKRGDRDYMRKSWEVEWVCGNRIRRDLIFIVTLSEDVEEWDADLWEWVYDHNESLETALFECDMYDEDR